MLRLECNKVLEEVQGLIYPWKVTLNCGREIGKGQVTLVVGAGDDGDLGWMVVVGTGRWGRIGLPGCESEGQTSC